MELLYLWIDNYNNFIINQGFNFSSKFNISFEPKSKEIKIEENINNIDGLFHKDILDITAIIGENGAGKSTLLKYLISECFTPVQSSPDRKKDFIIYKTKSKGKKDNINVYFIDKLKLNKDLISFPKNKYNLKIGSSNTNIYWNEIGEIKINDETVDNFNDTAFIYYSDVFDLKDEQDSNGLINIGTNNLLYKDSEFLTNNPQLNFSPILAHKIMELERQIKFVISRNINAFNLFNLPDHISIKPNETDWLSLNNTLKNLQTKNSSISSEDEKLRIFLESLFEAVEKSNTRKLKSDYIHEKKYIFRIAFLFNIVRYLMNFNGISDSIMKEKGYTKALDKLRVEIINCFNEDGFDINQFNDNATEYSLIVNDTISKQTKKYIEFEDLLFDEVEPKYEKTKDKIWGDINIDINFKGLPKLRKLLNESSTITQHSVFGWRNMSSGERAFITIFSRLYSIVDKIKEEKPKKKNILLFMDETELYFHPQWQKKIITFFTKEIPRIFNGMKIQIFVTSHTPFMLSDLPKQNVILLRKGTETNKNDIENSLKDKCIVSNETEDTFGANIYSLFNNSFFLQDGFMGEFAKKEIEGAICFLNYVKKHHEYTQYISTEDYEKSIKDDLEKDLKEVLSTCFNKKKINSNSFNKSYDNILKEKKQRVEKIINLIGEPIIKSQLIAMYEDVFKDDLDISKAKQEIQRIANKVGLEIEIKNQ